MVLSGPKQSRRANHTASRSGFGAHFTSPVKHGDTRKKAVPLPLGHAMRLADARSRLKARLNKEPAPSTRFDASPPPVDPSLDSQPNRDEEWVDEQAQWVDEQAPRIAPDPPPPPANAASCRRVADSWEELLPRLESSYADYYRSTHAQQRPVAPALVEHECTVGCTKQIKKVVKCLYPLYVLNVQIVTCECMPIAVLLVQHGVFPASPKRPRIGVSIDVLDLYRAMFERSCDAITALAAALHTVYDRRGFTVVSDRNPLDRVADPFRGSLTQAVQWSTNLHHRIARRLSDVLSAAEQALFPSAPAALLGLEPTTTSTASVSPAGRRSDVAEQALLPSVPLALRLEDEVMEPAMTSAAPSAPSAAPSAAPPAASSSLPAPDPAPLTPGRAHCTLRERCPACFGLTEWGRDLVESGGDVQLGSDGCFSFRHVRSAGDGSIGYVPTLFVPQHKVEAVAKRIKNARTNPRAGATPRIPREAVEACESMFDATNEKVRRGTLKRYNASGIFSMTCRHGQVLFLVNIYTPGEQQCYIIAALEELLSMLPPHATVLQAYDIGCVVDHSLDLFPILEPSLRNRVAFIINHMHSYRHGWFCQIVYSPRFHDGATLADHEDVERNWSRSRKLIPITRGQWNSRRICILDQFFIFLNEEGQENLGSWIERQQEKNLETKLRKALKTYLECRVPEAELRRQWEDQKLAQSSARSYAPVRVRRELDKVALLQAQIDGVEKAITDTKQAIAASGALPTSLALLRGLQDTHVRLSREADELYSSLDIRGAQNGAASSSAAPVASSSSAAPVGDLGYPPLHPPHVPAVAPPAIDFAAMLQAIPPHVLASLSHAFQTMNPQQ
ncbi:CxC1 domain-containing protein [Mycena venus]|uniref:CxC1 domain-containing protein n=1 Tax=Mycena venus TaxID=2733690 RepID=A0A8H7DDL7_9AGAR|nr:CxC1 domain-containing protein [Mycena venus]